MERHGFSFSPEAKQYAHDRSNGKCEFPGEECSSKPEPFVAHLTGCYEAFVNRRPQPDFKVFKDDRSAIRDVTQNGMIQCAEHNAFHDIQESYQVGMALTNGLRSGEHIIYEHKRSKSHGRRRGRR